MIKRFKDIFPASEVGIIQWEGKPAIRIKHRCAPSKDALRAMFGVLQEKHVVSLGHKIIIPTENVGGK